MSSLLFGGVGRIIGKCPEGHTRTVDTPARVAALCVHCDGTVKWRGVAATKGTRLCDGRCTGSKAAECQCSCEGKNHGSAWMAFS